MNKFLERAKSYFEGDVYPWWQNVVCKMPEAAQKHVLPLLLAGIFLSMRELLEALQQGGIYWRVRPFQVVSATAGGQPIRVLEKEPQGRVRKVSLWFDSAIGGPNPVIRVSTGATGTTGNGILMTPGVVNELGKIPANTELWVASDTTFNLYVVEEA